MQPALPPSARALAVAPQRRQHYLYFQPFTCTYVWTLVDTYNSLTPVIYFYPFFERLPYERPN